MIVICKLPHQSFTQNRKIPNASAIDLSYQCWSIWRISDFHVHSIYSFSSVEPKNVGKVDVDAEGSKKSKKKHKHKKSLKQK